MTKEMLQTKPLAPVRCDRGVSRARALQPFDAAAVGVAVLTREGRFVQANAAYCAIVGYSEEELAAGCDCLGLTHPDDVAATGANLYSLLAGDAPSFVLEKRYIRKDGTVIWVRNSMSLTCDAVDGSEFIVALCEDITERRKAEMALFQSERRFRQIIDALPAAVYTTDADGHITHFNPAAVALAGRKPQLHSDEWCVSWKLYDPDGSPLPHDQCPMAVSLKEGRPVRGAQAILERPDGTRRWFTPHPTPLRDDEGRIVGGVNMLIDITERKEAEERRKLLLNELNHRVKNTLAMVQALARQSLRNAATKEDAGDAFESRLIALARAHDVLTNENWASAELHDIVERATAPFCESKERVVVDGPSARLDPKQAVALSLALHELATNAAKYGALSSPGGRVSIGWTISDAGDVHMTWAEKDGPAVKPPSRVGFGSQLIEHGLASDLNGAADIDYRSDGVVCSIRFPLCSSRGETLSA